MAKIYLELNEIEQLEDAAMYLRDKLLIRLHLGCRISEALSLIVESLDFVDCTVTIQHLKTRLNLSCPNCSARLGRTHSFCSKCGKEVSQAVAKEQEYRRMRILALDQDTLEMLKEYIKRGGPVTQNGKKKRHSLRRSCSRYYLTSKIIRHLLKGDWGYCPQCPFYI
jgi:integrase/recombinase XerD